MTKRCPRKSLTNSTFCKRHRQCRGDPLSGSEPFADLEKYNKDTQITETHNCYSFAADVIDPELIHQCDGKSNCSKRFHQPGGTKNKAYILQESSNRNCKTVSDLMKMDIPDIARTSFDKKCPSGSSKIALVTAPGEDYHFYKKAVGKDKKGIWIHKDGSNPAKIYDAEGLPIVDPEYASRDYRPSSFLNYEDFCGFWCMPRNKQIKLSRD